MTFVLEEDKAPDPIDISLFGPDAVMFQAIFLTYKVEEFRFVRPRVPIV